MNDKRNPDDPYAAREARKYARPIASRERILAVMTDNAGPLGFDALAELLALAEDDDRVALDRRVHAMERDGQVIRNRRGAYLPVDESDLVRGRVTAHPDGFGFLVPDRGGDDLFLSPKQMRSLLHGDRAVVRLVGVDRQGRREGALVEVLERHNEQVVGRFFTEGGAGFVAPDNKRLHQDILIPPEHRGAAQSGQIVLAAIVEQPSKRSQPLGKVVEILGDHMAPGMEIEVAIRAHCLAHEWPHAVTAAAEALSTEVAEADKAGRIDLRDTPLVTIDGEDAKDFDDAVYCEPAGEGWRLLVAIADVSTYVSPGSALDAEAQRRGTSVYFPGQVVPMLPEALSNGLCSLNPEVERLCMVCDMHVGSEGRVRRPRFYQAVMRSAARLTYTEVAALVVERKAAARRRRKALVAHLDALYELYQALHQQRSRRGAIDFETPETQFVFGADRKIARIAPSERNDAHKLIEECMIAANVAAAETLAKHNMPLLYRAHEGPNADKLEDLRTFLGELGLRLGGGAQPKPKDYARLINQVGERADAHLIQTVLLRSLSQAVYTPDNKGHFGLALKAYAHFTSPIRRYPDLLVHRALRHVLDKGDAASFEYSHNDMVVLGEHCSMTERRAEEATRDAELWLKCEFMQDKVGERFDGIISGVTGFGVFVELDEIHVDGLVHITSLPQDYYRFDPVGHRLEGERSGRTYRLGDPLRVTVVRVDLDERKIDFEPVGTDERAPPSGRRRKGRKRKRKNK